MLKNNHPTLAGVLDLWVPDLGPVIRARGEDESASFWSYIIVTTSPTCSPLP